MHGGNVLRTLLQSTRPFLIRYDFLGVGVQHTRLRDPSIGRGLSFRTRA